MGEVGTPPITYFILTASQILNCSYLELAGHPERFQLMATAFTLDRGKRDGEKLLKSNPKFRQMIKAEAEREKKWRDA